MLKDKEVLDMISNLKYTVLTSDVEKEYFDAALKVVEENTGRFESFSAFFLRR